MENKKNNTTAATPTPTAKKPAPVILAKDSANTAKLGKKGATAEARAEAAEAAATAEARATMQAATEAAATLEAMTAEEKAADPAKVEALTEAAKPATEATDLEATAKRAAALEELRKKTPATPKVKPAYLTAAAYAKLVTLDKTLADFNLNPTADRKAIRVALNDLNKQIIRDRAKTFVDLLENEGRETFWNSYLTDWTVNKYTTKELEAGIVRSAKPEAAARVPYSVIDGLTPKDADNGLRLWRSKLEVMALHVLINWSKDEADPEAPAAATLTEARKDLSPVYADLDKEIYGEADAPKVSATAIQEQFNDICRDLFPEGLTMKDGLKLTIRAADRRAFVTAVMRWKKSTVNNSMTFRAASTSDIEAIFFEIVATRFNGWSYSIDRGGKVNEGTKKPAPVTITTAKEARAAKKREAAREAKKPAPAKKSA